MSHYYWDSVRRELSKSIKTAGADRAFAAIRAEHSALAEFLFPSDVVAFLWNKSGDYDRSNAVLAALLRAAQQPPEPALARSLLWLGLWPGLDAAYRRICRHRAEHPIEVAAALSAAFLRLVARQRLERITQVAATLVRSSARDAVSALRQERGYREGPLHTRLEVELDELPAPPSFEQRCTDFAEYLSALGSVESGLAVEVFFMAETRAAAGARFGLAEDASHKRLMRGVRRLRSEIDLKNVQISVSTCLSLLPDGAHRSWRIRPSGPSKRRPRQEQSSNRGEHP